MYDDDCQELLDYRVFHVDGDQIFLQSQNPECQIEQPQSDIECWVMYHAARVTPYGIPEFCFFNTEAIESAALADIGAKSGIQMSFVDNDDKADLPSDVLLSGPPEAVRAFVLERLTKGPLFCAGVEILTSRFDP